ncbi:MAG: hypothetical protein PHE55_05160 [Methylococcaceae bacterium]|nr:hypothetical protein [Methylococcaceae bacterium]
MAWSYSEDPTSSNLDAVRFLVQDTDSTRPLFQDAELNFLIGSEHNVYMAAAAACDIQAARQSSVKSKSVGDLSLSYFGPEEWKRRGELLRARGSAHQVLSAGGITVAAREALEEDDSLLQPYFTLGMHDNRSAPTGENEEEQP